MYCAHCGIQVSPEQKFCSRCGQPISVSEASAPGAQPTAPPQPSTSQSNLPASSGPYTPRSRVEQHLNILGIFWIIFSGLRLIPGLALMIFGHMHFPFGMMPIPAPVRVFLAPFLSLVGVAVSSLAIAGVIAGWGLMARYPWARVLSIVLGCISLIHFPLGTALGIYTLWVLASGRADAEYRSLARA